jgi:hypothetical protein
MFGKRTEQVAYEMLIGASSRFLTEGRDKRYASPMSKKPPRSKVSVEFEGKKYSATYYTTGRMVIVESAYGNEGMQRGGSKPEDVARMLLIQLLRAGKSRGRK